MVSILSSRPRFLRFDSQRSQNFFLGKNYQHFLNQSMALVWGKWTVAWKCWSKPSSPGRPVLQKWIKTVTKTLRQRQRQRQRQWQRQRQRQRHWSRHLVLNRGSHVGQICKFSTSFIHFGFFGNSLVWNRNRKRKTGANRIDADIGSTEPAAIIYRSQSSRWLRINDSRCDKKWWKFHWSRAEAGDVLFFCF